MRAMKYFGLCCALTVCMASSGCESLTKMLANMDKPGVRVTGANIAGLSMNQADLMFDLEVSNPYSVPLPLASLDYTLEAAGAKLFDGKTKLDGVVPAGGKRTIQLPLSVGFAKLFSAAKGVKPGEVVPYKATMGLAADAPGIGEMRLPVSKQGELPVPAAPEVKLTQMKIEKLSMSSLQARVGMAVKNTNKFNFGLDTMEYNLHLAGSPVGSAKLAEAAQLAPGESAEMSFPIQVNPLAIGMGFYNMLTGSDASYKITGNVKGATPFGPLSLPFDRSGKMPLSR